MKLGHVLELTHVLHDEGILESVDVALQASLGSVARVERLDGSLASHLTGSHGVVHAAHRCSRG